MKSIKGFRLGPAGYRQLIAILCVIALLYSWIGATARAQEDSPSPTPAAPAINKTDLHQALLDLTNPWTVMCVAAHPDDEDGTTLTVLRRKHGVHTVSLFSTYGEGGQNAIGPELYEELGVIRARETINASQIQGSEPYFLGLKDFGFSKSIEETFRVWGREEALRRMVLKLRELRPDVIITNHDTTRGHGHHQATGQLIIEAFDAAADPKRFPEQLKDLNPWQAQRLFVRVFGGSRTESQAPADDKIVAIDPNQVDPIRGNSFAEQALTALQQHASQGPWPKTVVELLRTRGGEGGKLPLIRYRLVREAPNTPPLPSTVLNVGGGMPSPGFVAGLIPPTTNIPSLTKSLDQPDQLLEDLIQLCMRNTETETPPVDPVRLRFTAARLDKALALAAGVSLTVSSNDPVLIPGTKTTFAINLTNAGSKPLQITQLSFSAWGKEFALDTPDHLLADTDTSVALDAETPATAAYTVPKPDHLYDESVFGIPFKAKAEIDIEGAKFEVNTQTNLDVVPAVEIKNISPSPCVRTEETLGRCKLLKVTLSSHLATPFRGTIRMVISKSGSPHTVKAERQFVLGPFESRNDTPFVNSLIPDRENLRELRSSGSAVISISRSNTNDLIMERTVPVVYANATVAADLHVGYVPSFDQTLENSLGSLGVEAKALTVDEIRNTDLSSYDTIIIDNRGYEAHLGLVDANPRLLQFVEQGGTLIVFYHKDNEWNPDPARNRPQLAPYPILLGSERVTDENAPVRFLQPRHLLLNYPNRMAQADFKNWIQERGLYYPKEWDKRYAALFAMNDKGEPALRGGLLVGRHGKGNYIYTSMVWYRQLRAGVPGAYRMLANMISYGHHQLSTPRRRGKGRRLD